jgi:hypothetical protein
MRLALGCLIAAATLAQSPAFAEPAIKTSMPAIRAAIADGQLVVRMQRGVLGTAHSMDTRTMVVVARDAQGGIVYESTTPVSRRMTYAHLAATPALQSAATVSVSLR